MVPTSARCTLADATTAVYPDAIAESDEALKISDLADRRTAPESDFEQILPMMRNAGLVGSERGRSRGHRLNRPAEEITLERVVRLFEGQLAPIACATWQEPEPCPMTVGCSRRTM